MASDNVRLMCPNLKCRAVLSVPGEARGKHVRCRNCGTRIMVPGPGPAAAAPIAPPAPTGGGRVTDHVGEAAKA